MSNTPASTLPIVYQNHFKNAARQYDNKEFKKALSSVEKILISYPEHADSLALKALVIRALNSEDREESYRCIEQALKFSDNKSFMAWNVYGTMKRDDHDYATALTCFQNALKLDPNNLSILNDLSFVQLQVRDFKGLVQSRNSLLQQKPQFWFYWIGAIIANHLAKNYQVAVSLIDTFLKQYDLGVINGSSHKMTKYELSELLLYKASILLEQKDFKQAIKHLNIVEPYVKDRVSYLEYKGLCLLNTNRKEDAKKIYRELLSLNSENYEYWSKLQEAFDLPSLTGFGTSVDHLSEHEREKLNDFYEQMKLEYPNANACSRIVLNFLNEEKFEREIDKYVRPFLHSNVPSLFSNLKALYSDQRKVQIIEQVMLHILESLEQSSLFPNSTSVEPPTTLLWVYLYMAYHYDKIHNLERALNYIDKAIEHTPTAIELYMCKARILKHAGSLSEAADQMDLARTLDLADRYLNTKTVKYLNRADRTEQAESTMFLFAKDQDGKLNVVEMQAMEYEIETGYSYLRQEKFGRALKWFYYVLNHFNEFRNDQYDFHSYCIRKYLMRPYISMLHYMDTLEHHKYYFRAATGVLKVYLAILSKYSAEGTGDATEIKNSLVEQNATAAEIAEYEKLFSGGSGSDKKADKRSTTLRYKKDAQNDPFGNKLIPADEATLLSEADKVMKTLNEFCSDRIETHLLATQLYLFNGRYLHAMKSLKEAKRLDSAHPQLHVLICQFFNDLDNGKIPESMARLIKTQQSQLMEEATGVEQFNELYLKKGKDQVQLDRLLAYAKVGFHILKKTDQKDSYTQMLLDNITRVNDSQTIALESLIRAYEALRDEFKDKQAAESFKVKASQFYPHCTIFQRAAQ